MISQKLENQYSIRQERREGFIDDTDAIYAKLQYQLAAASHGQPAMQRQTLIDTRVWSLPVGWGRDSLNPSQETDGSLDFGQTSVDLESRVLDSDPASPEDRCRQAEETAPESVRSPDPSSRLSLSFEDFQPRETTPVDGGNIQQDAEDG